MAGFFLSVMLTVIIKYFSPAIINCAFLNSFSYSNQLFLFPAITHTYIIHQGPIVQSIVSLTKSLVADSLSPTKLIISICSNIFAEKSE